MHTRTSLVSDRAKSGKAEYGKFGRITSASIEDPFEEVTLKTVNAIGCPHRFTISLTDLLFGESNFFEVLFGNWKVEVNIGDFVQEKVARGSRTVNIGYMRRCHYYKMICARIPNKLQYLNFVLPKNGPSTKPSKDITQARDDMKSPS